MKLHTRQDIIDMWLKQSKELLNLYVCPNCRDILYYDKINNSYECKNKQCLSYRLPLFLTEE